MKTNSILIILFALLLLPALVLLAPVASAQTVLNDSLHPGHITMPRVWFGSPAQLALRITHSDTSAKNDTLIIPGYRSTYFTAIFRRTKSAAKPLTPPPVYLAHLTTGIDTVIVVHQGADTLTYDMAIKRKLY